MKFYTSVAQLPKASSMKDETLLCSFWIQISPVFIVKLLS